MTTAGEKLYVNEPMIERSDLRALWRSRERTAPRFHVAALLVISFYGGQAIAMLVSK